MRLVRLVDIEPAFGMEAPVHPDAPDSVTPVLVDRGVFPMVLPVSLAGLIVLDLRRAEFEDPGPQLRPGELLDRAILAESANRAVKDHPVPLEGLGRGAFGGLRGEEQIDGPAECQVPARIRCPSIRGRRIRCPKIGESGAQTMFVASCDEPRVGVQARYAGPSLVPTTTSCGSARSWLARKDSNLQSPDPESGALPFGHSPAAELTEGPKPLETEAGQAHSPAPVRRTFYLWRQSGAITSTLLHGMDAAPSSLATLRPASDPGIRRARR
jgi:hypothetical protein